MDARRAPAYHKIKFVNIQNNRVVCCPTSWVRWEDKESKMILVAYPDEPSVITRERVRNSESPGRDWNSYLAQIMYSTDFYDHVIRCFNENVHGVEESCDCKVIVSEAGSPGCSYLSEFQKWPSKSADPNFVMVNGMEVSELQSESSGSVINVDSDDDVPCDFFMRSSESRCTNEQEDSIENIYCPEVIITEDENWDVPLSPNPSQIFNINEGNTFWSGFQTWFLNLPSLAGPRSSMINRLDENSKLQVILSENLSNRQSENGDDDDDAPCDLSISSSGTDKRSKASSILEDALTSPEGTDNRWTLKHRQPSPGLVELWPNTGVYITETELKDCLRKSMKCTQLARFLTSHIFSESALRKCRYVNNVSGSRDLRLDAGATTAIVNFVLTYGNILNWRRSSDRSIKSAMRYQLILSKTKQSTV